MLTLAQLLGFPHPDYMLKVLTARQLADWQAWLHKFQPFPNRNDYFHAMQLCMYFNAHCDERDRCHPHDFLIYHDPLDRFEHEMTVDELRMKLGLPA